MVQDLVLLPDTPRNLGSVGTLVEFACSGHDLVDFRRVPGFPPAFQSCAGKYIYYYKLFLSVGKWQIELKREIDGLLRENKRQGYWVYKGVGFGITENVVCSQHRSSGLNHLFPTWVT